MRKSSGILLAACLLAATPALAGTVTFEETGAVWKSSKCEKPVPPELILEADPETPGNKMNEMISAYNTYAGAAQAYMNCISRESDADQRNVVQAISSGAKEEIKSILEESEKLAIPLRRTKK